MGKIYVPSKGPDEWRELLADRDKHWKPKYSAHALAHCWEKANGLPVEISHLFAPQFSIVELLLAIPEYKVALPGGGRESQNDLFCLLKADGQLMALMVEGKVDEPFDRSVGDWLVDASPGKRERMSFLCQTLGLSEPVPPDIRYQLLHRTASALITAKRFGAGKAAMIVHSFSPSRKWLADYQAFVRLWGIETEPSRLEAVKVPDGRDLLLGWASGTLPG